MKKLILSFAACAAMLTASAGPIWNLGGVQYEADTLFHETTGPGVTTTGIRLIHPNNKTNIFYSTIDLTNPNIELRGVQAKDNPDVTETVLSMGDRKNKAGKGHYLAGVNADFFNMGGSPTRTNGHSVVDGNVYNTGVGSASWQTYASYATVEGAKDVKILEGVQAMKTITFPNGQTHQLWINSERWAGYAVIYTPEWGDSTNTNGWGRECQLKLVEGSIADNTAVFEVTSDYIGHGGGDRATEGNMEIPKDGYVLSCVSDAFQMMAQLKIGDRVSMGAAVKYNGKFVDFTQVLGGCPMLVREGEVASQASLTAADVNIKHLFNNEARTVIGYNKDRTKLIILVADKISSNPDANTGLITKDSEKYSWGTSTGFTATRIAHIMKFLGCYTAMNFDGGGSANLYNEKLGVRNNAYGGHSLRPVANGFFAVAVTPDEDNTIAALEVRKKDVKLAEGETFTPVVYGYNKYGVLVDKNVSGFTLEVAPSLGTVDGTSFVAGSAEGSTLAVVSLGDVKCGFRVYTNGGGEYVTSGDDNAPLMVGTSYTPDEPMGIDREPLHLTAQWKFVNDRINDGWDGANLNWSSDSVKTKSCPRFATARNGRFYTVDMVTMSIAEIDPEGNLIPRYKLPSLEGRTVNGIPDYYGTAISSDDAGNFLIGHLFTKAETFRVWTVYSPSTNKAKHFEVELPEGELSSGRIDNIGRVVGDLTREAYAYVAPKATGAEESQHALILAFKGNGDVNSVELTPSMTEKHIALAGVGNTFSTIQPRYATVAEMKGLDLNNTFFWYSKDGGVDENGNKNCLFTFDNGVMSRKYSADWNNYSRLNGFDTFVLGGKRYFVVHFADAIESGAGNNSGQHIIVFDEQSNRVAEWNDSEYTSSAGYNTITAVPNGEDQVNIYVYNCDIKHIGGALLTLTLGREYTAVEPVDITPAGYDFDQYEEGAPFPVTAGGINSYDVPAFAYHTLHPEAFTKNGHLTMWNNRVQPVESNTQEYIDANVQPGVTIRKHADYLPKLLTIIQPWSPAASRFDGKEDENGVVKPLWQSIPQSVYGEKQISFYVRNEDITNEPDRRHYIRIRLVYQAMLRGCHYTVDLKSNKVTDLVRTWAFSEAAAVVPANDNLTATTFATTGLDCAQWIDETGNVEDIPAKPEVRPMGEDEFDPWDPGHAGINDGNGKPAYVINDRRFRVVEYDTYIDDPANNSVCASMILANRNTTYFIKEVKFTDLGTDEAAANLLRTRRLGWEYLAKDTTTGIEDIVSDEAAVEAEGPAVYYNLQGVEIKNPDNGIYIVRRGNTVTKEYISK